MKPTVAIIIVNWNGKADTLECLASLREDTYASKQIIVVDNGSTDDSVAAIRSEYPDATILETGHNLGFTGGNNVGIRHALELGTKYVYLLNNDTKVEPNALTALVKALAANPQYGLVTPVIHYFDRPDEAWFAGSQMDLLRGTAVHDNSRVPARTDAPSEIPWASGCAMLIRAEVTGQLGGFDERYFLNWEDVDLCLRVRALGKSIGLVPTARIYHKVGRSFASASSSGGHYYYVRNNLLLISIHSGSHIRYAFCVVIINQIREYLRAIKNGRASNSSRFITTFQAIQDHFQKRYGQRLV